MTGDVPPPSTTAVTTASTPADTLRRFSRGEHRVHRVFAGLMGVCLVTGFVLYYGPATVLIGHRFAVELVHVVAGYALPVPLLAGAFSRAFRADVRRLDRFGPTDWRWLRSRTRRDGAIAVGKFNAGQKLNSSITAGSVLVLLGTGTLMLFPGLVRLSWRTGATFAHDWFSLGLGLLAIGHIAFALRDPEAGPGLRTGVVSRGWAERHHAAWVTEVDAARDPHPEGDARLGPPGIVPDERPVN